MAEHSGLQRTRFNAHMRATTSTAWMVGPALSYIIADQLGGRGVFIAALAVGILWLLLTFQALPRRIIAPAPQQKEDGTTETEFTLEFRLAIVFVFCLAVAHTLTFLSLPLFFVQEVGLPGYAPGLAFTVKTFVEVIAIFTTPYIIARFSLRHALIATSVLAIVAIQVLASVAGFSQMLAGAALEGLYFGFFSTLGISYVQSFALHRPASTTAIYWNTMIVTGLLCGPVVGLIAQASDFRSVIQVASVVAVIAILPLLASHERKTH